MNNSASGHEKEKERELHWVLIEEKEEEELETGSTAVRVAVVLKHCRRIVPPESCFLCFYFPSCNHNYIPRLQSCACGDWNERGKHTVNRTNLTHAMMTEPQKALPIAPG